MMTRRLREKTPHQRIRELAATKLIEAESLQLGEITDAVFEQLSGDEEFVRAYLRRELRRYVHAEIQAFVAEARRASALGQARSQSVGDVSLRTPGMPSRFVVRLQRDRERRHHLGE